jgi:hypothetical protein
VVGQASRLRNPLVTSAGRAVSKWTLCGAGPVDAARNIYRDRGHLRTPNQSWQALAVCFPLHPSVPAGRAFRIRELAGDLHHAKVRVEERKLTVGDEVSHDESSLANSP